MHDITIQNKVITDESHKKTLKGALHLLIRTFPLLFEDNKELLMRCMWRE